MNHSINMNYVYAQYKNNKYVVMFAHLFLTYITISKEITSHMFSKTEPKPNDIRVTMVTVTLKVADC